MALFDSFTRRRSLTREEKLVALTLAGGRIAIGTGIWLAPKLALKVLGFGDEPSTAELTLARMAGARDLILGVWHATVLDDPDELRRATNAITFADLGDSAAFALVAKAGGPKQTALLGLGAAVPATAMGAWLSQRLK
ncbi:hypothetical protein HJD18_00660 [Thermoleophilia bacterium SCSIO 60948]|nr:hypothetical protein HJD18_00660 [Thermoleophilia bacterium SCSIO 60948]